MLYERVADESFMRLIGKCLHVGVLDGEEYSMPSEGTAQGSVLSPILGNIYLHHVLDRWFRDEVTPTLEGRTRLDPVRGYFVMGFSSEKDARRVREMLSERMAAFGLTLHPDKARVLPFGRPARSQTGKGPATFDFLGFTLYWRRTTSGKWVLGMRTRKARLQKAISAIGDHCRRHRHDSLKEQHLALTRRVQGHFNYFGVNGNIRALGLLVRWVERL